MYRVHDFLFARHSSYWAQKITNDASTAAPVELNDVTVYEMDALMSVLYDGYVRSAVAQLVWLTCMLLQRLPRWI